jgi:hypothetical protein
MSDSFCPQTAAIWLTDGFEAVKVNKNVWIIALHATVSTLKILSMMEATKETISMMLRAVNNQWK